MRIIGGKHRGRKLADFKVGEIRPTADRVKESLFNILSVKAAGARVLDLFCGSGNLGLESLSRGAEYVLFNDLSKDSLSVLKKNLAAVGEGDKCKITNLDYSLCLNSAGEKFDIVFIDPPYAKEFGVPALEIIAKRGLLTEGGVAVYERDRPFVGSIEGLEMYDERKYGKTYLSFFH
ncbi:MAG: 16S rRNA (guanine(966)-N(2))-methyltransferase RsmD [Clostridiales bacterium]|nr:16S rRNA (guanine(966)-N(2))-methyltransferase RsmD [Clostridiales bacterium]